jgi:MOSC domain-containing protein YiiM
MHGPGIIPENVTTEGLDVDGLAIAQRLRPAQVALEVSAVCDPCEQLAALRPGLRAEMQGRRGMLCRVLTGGTLQRGDVIELQEKTLTAENSGAH